MSIQDTLTNVFEPTPYRSIVKDAYTTRDEGDTDDTRLEIAAWVVMKTEGDLQIKEEGRLLYDRILRVALGDTQVPGVSEVTSTELAERTELKSYRDDQGGRSASTIRGYLNHPDRLRRLPSSHPIKRVLRRWARSQDLGHFEDQEAVDREPELGAEPISMQKLFAAYRLARSIASQEGFSGFVPQEGEPVAEEDNERIDEDEIRGIDRPLGDTKAAAILQKPNGSIYEYWVDLDEQELVPADDAIPPTGW